MQPYSHFEGRKNSAELNIRADQFIYMTLCGGNKTNTLPLYLISFDIPRLQLVVTVKR